MISEWLVRNGARITGSVTMGRRTSIGNMPAHDSRVAETWTDASRRTTLLIGCNRLHTRRYLTALLHTVTFLRSRPHGTAARTFSPAHRRDTMNARRIRYSALSLLVLALGACTTLTTQPEPSGWNAEILGEGEYPNLKGTLGAGSQMGATVVEIQLLGVASTLFNWRLATGTCISIRSNVGAASAYPSILTTAQGSGTSRAELNQMLSPDGQYVVVIRTEDGEIAGCGNLVRQVFSANHLTDGPDSFATIDADNFTGVTRSGA